jgi:hypothetical protein
MSTPAARKPVPNERGTCSSCGAAIIWVVMYPSGARMPLDAKPIGGLIKIELGFPDTGHARGKDSEPLYLSHFATCPNAAQHRKARK